MADSSLPHTFNVCFELWGQLREAGIVAVSVHCDSGSGAIEFEVQKHDATKAHEVCAGRAVIKYKKFGTLHTYSPESASFAMAFAKYMVKHAKFKL